MKEALKHGLCNNILAQWLMQSKSVSVSCLVIVKLGTKNQTKSTSIYIITLCKLMHFHKKHFYNICILLMLLCPCQNHIAFQSL